MKHQVEWYAFGQDTICLGNLGAVIAARRPLLTYTFVLCLCLPLYCSLAKSFLIANSISNTWLVHELHIIMHTVGTFNGIVLEDAEKSSRSSSSPFRGTAQSGRYSACAQCGTISVYLYVPLLAVCSGMRAGEQEK